MTEDQAILIFGAILILIFVAIIYYLPTKLTYGTHPLKQRQIYNRCKKNIEKLVPTNWMITDFSPTTIRKRDSEIYSVYVEVHKKQKKKAWTNDTVLVNESGRIISEGLTENIKIHKEYQDNK